MESTVQKPTEHRGEAATARESSKVEVHSVPIYVIRAFAEINRRAEASQKK
jgi:hypothetical protein